MVDFNHINLIGDPEENFYSLGAKDKDSYQEIYTLISRLCARNDILAKAIKATSEIAVNINKRGQINLQKELQAYADGLERPIKDVYFTLLLPEIVASFNKWAPNLMSIIPGCSSLFTYNKKSGSTIHTRVLDYALAGPFEKYERSMKVDFKERLNIFGLNTIGLPFPSISSMNEAGLTLALHYKHGDFLNLNGDSIFSITYQILSYCTSIHDVKKFLKNYPSMAYWGLYLSDKTGLVTSIDVKGTEIHQEKFDIRDHDYLYFNNRPILKDNNTDKLQPYGNLNQCTMRRKSLMTKIKGHDLSSLDSSEVLKIISSYPEKNKPWKLDLITPSSIQVLSFDYKNNECHTIKGQAPKFYNGKLIKFTQLFDDVSINLIKDKSKLNKSTYIGLQKLSLFQSALDSGDTELAYHHIQMCYEYLKHSETAPIIRFYILVIQYIYESNKKDLAYLYNDFKELEGKLPSYLNDHNILFLMRLEKLLGHPVVADSQKINNKNLRILFDKEKKLKSQAILILKRLIFPRVEILDILYGY
jgi:hypothetical protein